MTSCRDTFWSYSSFSSSFYNNNTCNNNDDDNNNNNYTVDSRYLEFQGTLRNTSRYPYFDISDLQN